MEKIIRTGTYNDPNRKAFTSEYVLKTGAEVGGKILVYILTKEFDTEEEVLQWGAHLDELLKESSIRSSWEKSKP